MISNLLQEYAALKKRLDEIDALIKEDVMRLEKSVSFGNVTATYTKGRGSYDYHAIASEANPPEDVISACTEPKTDWKAVCDTIAVSEELRQKHYKHGTPSVSIKIKDGDK